MNYLETLQLHLHALTPLIYVGATSPEAVTEELSELASSCDMSVTVTSAADANTSEKDPVQILDTIIKTGLRNKNTNKRTLFILQFYHLFLKDPDPLILAKFRRIADAVMPFTTTIIIGTPHFKVPPELSDVCCIEARLSRETIEHLIRTTDLKASTEEFTQLTQALSGCITQAEVETLLALSIVKSKKNGRALSVSSILEERKLFVQPRHKKAFEIVEPTFGLEHIGGMDDLRYWIKMRVPLLWNQSLREFNMTPPRGLLLIGPPGCGKTCLALAMGKSFELPVFKLNTSRLFQSQLGESEATFNQVLDTLYQFNTPLIFFIDEIEKLFSLRNGEMDGNTAYRLLSAFLDFLGTHQNRIFTIATCNSIWSLPPELLRKGRFDEIFYIPFPEADERKAILDAICKKYSITITDTDQLVKELDGFTGSEIEQVIKDAIYDSIMNQPVRKSIPELNLIRLARKMVPLKVTMGENLLALEDWARTKCRWASQRV